MCKLVILLSCLVCLTAAGRLGLERKLHWLLPTTMTGQNNKISAVEEQMPLMNQRQKFLLDVLLQVQKPLLNAELIDMGNMLLDQPEMYLEMDDDLLVFLEQIRQHDILGRNELFSVLNEKHVHQLLGLYKFLVLARDWTTFQRNVCFARLHINPLMLVNALQMALKTRADTQELIMPAMNEIMPQLFYDRDVIAAAQNVDWLNLINGRPLTTVRPGLVDVLGLRGLGMGLASRTAGLWRPWQDWRMKMINEKLAMRDNIIRNKMGMGMMGMQMGGLVPHPIVVASGRSVEGDAADQMLIEAQETIVVPVPETLGEATLLTDDVDLNIFWNNVMTERLMQSMHSSHQQKLMGGVGKMWNINNRMTDVGDMTLDEVLKAQQQMGMPKRTTGVWGERQNNMETSLNNEREEHWLTEENNEEDNMSGENSWMLGKLTGNRMPWTNRMTWTPVQTMDNLPVSDVNNQRLLHVNRRRAHQMKANRMIDNPWKHNIDEQNRETMESQRQGQGMWNQQLQEDENDMENSMMGNNRQMTMNSMRQGRWSTIGNGRRVADSDEHRNHGHETNKHHQTEVDRAERMQRFRTEQDNDETRTNRWNTDSWTEQQIREEINNNKRMQRLREEQDHDEGRSDRWKNGRWTQEQERKEIDNIERMQQRLREEQHSDEDRSSWWNSGRWSKQQEREEIANMHERMQRLHDNDADVMDRRNNERWTENRDQDRINTNERMQQGLRGGQDNDEARNIRWNTNIRDNVQKWGHKINSKDISDNDDDNSHQRNQWRMRETMDQQTRTENEQWPNNHWLNSRRDDMLDTEHLANRHITTNDDDNIWVRQPRSINTIDNQMLHTPADELMRLRSGELFIQNLQQLLARINMDRLALTLEGIAPNVDVMSINPNLLTTSGIAYHHQNAINEAVAKQSIRQMMQELKSIIDGMLERKQIDKRGNNEHQMMQIIASVIMDRSNDERDGGNIADVLYARVNRIIYGLENTEQVQTPSILSTPTSCLRAPIYQYIVSELVQLIDEYQVNLLRPYTVADLSAPGVTVNDIDIDRLITYTELVDSDLINLVDQQLLQTSVNNLPKMQKRVVARQQRLNHQPFTMTLDIESQREQRVVVRIFLGPKTDAAGRVIRDLNENRQNFVQLDAFVKNLERGTNVFQRQSRDIEWTQGDVSTLHEIYNRVMSGQSLSELHGSNCGFPQRLLLPRGTTDGLPVQLLVVVTPVSVEDRLLEQLVEPTSHLCGLGIAAMALDHHSLGFPLDRPIVPRALPNILLRDVMIEHDSRVRV